LPMPVYRTRPTIRLSDRGFGRTLSGGKIAQSKRARKLKARKPESQKARKPESQKAKRPLIAAFSL